MGRMHGVLQVSPYPPTAITAQDSSASPWKREASSFPVLSCCCPALVPRYEWGLQVCLRDVTSLPQSWAHLLCFQKCEDRDVPVSPVLI